MAFEQSIIRQPLRELALFAGAGGGFLAESFSAGSVSVQLSETDTLPVFWLRDKMTKASRLSQFGMTCLPSMGTLGEALLTSYRAAFPARTSAPLEKALVLVEKNPAYGESSLELLAKYDPDTSSWKTPQLSLLGESEPYSETWPRWGMMLNGASYRQQIPSGLQAIRSLITSGSASGSSQRMPTPLANDAMKRGLFDMMNPRNGLPAAVRRMQTPVADDCWDRKRGKINSRGEPKLSAQVLRMPTVKASDATRGDCPSEQHRSPPMLLTAAKRVPSPRAMDARGGNGPASRDPSLANMVRANRVPTQTARDWRSESCSPEYLEKREQETRGKTLPWVITNMRRRVPTPQASDASQWNNHTAEERQEKGHYVRLQNALSTEETRVGGALNPTWVEWLMGWPLGWTALEPLETDSMQRWSQQLGTFSEAEMIRTRIRERTMPWLIIQDKGAA